MTNSNYKDGHAHLFSKHVDSINWFSVAIIFKATYARKIILWFHPEHF